MEAISAKAASLAAEPSKQQTRVVVAADEAKVDGGRDEGFSRAGRRKATPWHTKGTVGVVSLADDSGDEDDGSVEEGDLEATTIAPLVQQERKVAERSNARRATPWVGSGSIIEAQRPGPIAPPAGGAGADCWLFTACLEVEPCGR